MSEKILAVLGKFIVERTFDRTRLYEYAAAFDEHRINPQIAKIELVSGSRPFIRVILKGKIIKSWKNENIGINGNYWIYDNHTWNFAGWTRNGYYDVAKIELSEDYKVMQHSDRNGKLCFYDDGDEMIRIVKSDGSAIGIAMSYWSSEINGIWKEELL